MSKTATLVRSRLTRQRIAELRMKCQEDPDAIITHQEAVDVFLGDGLYAEALPFLRRLSALRPNDVLVATQLAAVLTAQGDDRGALEQCKHVARLAPDSIEPQHNLGVAACKLGDHATACFAFQRKLELDPASYETYNDLAVIHALLQNPEEAAKAYLRCLEINPRYEKARDNAFQFFWEQGRFNEGLRLAERLLETVGHDTDLVGWRDRFSEAPYDLSSSIPLERQGGGGAVAGRTRVTRKNIAFVASSDAFLGPILTHFRRENSVRIFSGRSREELAELLHWADLTWFEWCDGLAVEASRLPRTGKAVCRLHSYEAFTDAPAQMNWPGIDCLILVSSSVGEILDQGPALPVQRTIIHNGVDPGKFPFIARPGRGKKIASVGYINYKKNPSLLLQTFKAIHDWDSGFELHIAGEHQDPRIKVYFDNLLPRLNLPITFHGWVKDMPTFYAQMDYVISTSLFESFHYSIAEGMLSGCLPLIHSWKGADQLYPPQCVFDTPGQAVELIKGYTAADSDQIARDHRTLIVERYNWNDRLDEIDCLLSDILADKQVQPRRRCDLASLTVPGSEHTVDHGMVSIVIVASNDAPHVKDAVATALSQTYRNTEVIVCDDGSTDDTETQLEHFGGKITVIRQVRRGLAAALNTAIQHSHGVYIAPLLAGEAFAPDKIAKQVSRLAGQPDLNIIACGTDFVDEDPNHPAAGFESALAAWGGSSGSEGLDRVPFSAVVFRRSLLDQVGWFEESDPESLSPTNPLASLHHRMTTLYGPQSMESLDEPLVYVRSHNTHQTSTVGTPATDVRNDDRWAQTVRVAKNRAQLSQPKPCAENPPKTGAKVVFVGAVDPGGQMAMWAQAINRFTSHRARVLTHSESMGFPVDLVLKRRDYGRRTSETAPSAMKILEEAETAATDADMIVFAAGLAPGSLRSDAKLCDTDEQDYGTIHWPDVVGKKKRAALLFGTASVRANLTWYRERFASKGWPILTCESDIHRWLPEAHYMPRLLSRDGLSIDQVQRRAQTIAIIHPGGLEPFEGGEMIGEVAAALKARFPHIAFGQCQDMAWADVLDMKRQAHIGFDRISVGTGHFGLASLENSALGMVNVVYCDPYARGLLAQTLGTDELPWETPATQSELTAVLEKYMANPEVLDARMQMTRQWFDAYWDERRIVSVLADVLERL